MDRTWIALIPAYQPEALLLKILQDAARAKFTLIVVDDGSGPKYKEIFERASEYAVVLEHEVNRGKGRALKTGMEYIRKHYDNYVVVTMDADGQHALLDAFRLCCYAQEEPETLMLGSRKMDREVPLRSKLGNTITRGVYRLATGKKVYDTQTGLRAFTEQLMDRMLGIQGERYEYEMNVLLEFSKNNTPIREVRIRTLYLNNNAGSHFNTLKDSFRIYREIILFSLSSFTGFLVDYGLYSMLLLFTAGLGSAVSICLSNVVARVVSAGVNYSMNRKLVFRSEEGTAKTASQYFALAAGILAGNTLVLSLLTGLTGIDPMAAKILTEMAFFLVSWVVQKYVIFRRKEAEEHAAAF